MKKDLTAWLDWQARLHPQTIDLGLTRCQTVAERLGLLAPPFSIITVGGTNGKGSSVALLEAMLSAAGYRVGCYTSPHLLRYNERIRIAGQAVTDEALCQAFEQVEVARQITTLTYFEFGTLAAMWLFLQNPLDIVVLEVGLGGRLDAVNIFDPTIALLTPIDIDHTDWLGTERESIAFEKAGILRTQRPAVCNDINPPQRLLQQAQCLSTPLYCLGKDFTFAQTTLSTWHWQNDYQQYSDLPLPYLAGDFQIANAAGVLMVLTLLESTFPISAIRQGLINAQLPGRFQVLNGRTIVDVAHNALGVRALKQALIRFPCCGHTHALVGILSDKDSTSMFDIMLDMIDHWHLAPLRTPRSADIAQLVQQLQALGISSIHTYPQITTAYRFLSATIPSDDRIIAFGSFFTVAEVLNHYHTTD